MALLNDGVLIGDELAAQPGVPSEQRLMEGPVVIIECAQEIPCNPCEDACRKGAISIGNPTTKLPVLSAEKCGGCGLCIAECPGQAIFVVDMTFSPGAASVQLPYEFYPVPEPGAPVNALDRTGEIICRGKVEKVVERESFDRTAVITVSVPKEHAMTVRNIALEKE